MTIIESDLADLWIVFDIYDITYDDYRIESDVLWPIQFNIYLVSEYYCWLLLADLRWWRAKQYYLLYIFLIIVYKCNKIFYRYIIIPIFYLYIIYLQYNIYSIYLFM
jgi:hypothetical protein